MSETQHIAVPSIASEAFGIQQIPDGDKIAGRLRHLVALDLQEAVVHPVVRHRGRAVRAARLRDLVFMVRKDQVETAAMDIEDVAEMGGGSWPSIRYASPAGRGPTGFPSPAHRRRIASTARSRPGFSCGRRPPPAPQPVVRRACGPQRAVIRHRGRYRTGPRRPPDRHGRARSIAGSASPCRSCRQCGAARNRWRGVRRSAAGPRAPPRRRETAPAVASVTLRIASFSGRPGKSRAARALILSSTSVMLRT